MLIRDSLLFFFLMIRRPPRSTPFPTRRSSDLQRRGVQPHALQRSPPSRAPTSARRANRSKRTATAMRNGRRKTAIAAPRSEEHTSELQSQSNLVCRLLLEKKKNPSPPAQIAGR